MLWECLELDKVNYIFSLGYKTWIFDGESWTTDVYRAANNLLRMALDGRLCLCMRPPNFTAQRGKMYFIYCVRLFGSRDVLRIVNM